VRTATGAARRLGCAVATHCTSTPLTQRRAIGPTVPTRQCKPSMKGRKWKLKEITYIKAVYRISVPGRSEKGLVK